MAGAVAGVESLLSRPIADPVATAPADRRRILVIFNPVAGRRRRQRLDAVLALLYAAGCAIELRPTTRRGDAEAFAEEAEAGEVDVVLAAGGDGTINEVAHGMLGSGVALALCPLGTANVLAAEIGLDTAPETIAATVLHGKVLPMWPGVANGRLFVQMVGVGFDAHVVRGVTPRVKRLLGKGAYVLETLRQQLRYRFTRFRVTIDGVTHEASSAIIAKGHFYAGRFVCAPDARPERPDFQVCLFLSGGLFSIFRYGAAMLFGRVPTLSDVKLVTGREILVEGPPGDPVQGDGDTLTELPLRVAIAPSALPLLVPAAR
jgi:YegS/Rv2252/BmrU family lipid kinase